MGPVFSQWGGHVRNFSLFLFLVGKDEEDGRGGLLNLS